MPPEQVTLEWFARNYHFSDEQTLDLGVDALEWWPVIALARAETARLESEQQTRLQQGRARHGSF